VIAFLNRVGDRMNPIVVKEMRQAVSSRFVSWSLVIFLVVEALVMTLMLLGKDLAHDQDAQDMRLGREIFTILQAMLMACCMLLIPVMTGFRLAVERSDVNVDLLFISSLSPQAIMAGKLLAAVALALLLFSACAPFMTFAYLLRGLDIPTILLVLVSDFVVVVLGTMFALLVASIPATRAFKVVLGVLAAVGLIAVSVGFQNVTTEFLEFDRDSLAQSWDFWLGYTGLVALIGGLIGLMFVWATALISPPTSNRALLVRVYIIGYWLFGMIAFTVFSIEVKHPAPIYAAGFLGTVFFSFQMLIATSERDEWGLA
jgi:hypothetical protein